MSLQTRETLVNFVRDFFSSIESYATTILTLQKVHKAIVKLIHTNWAI